MACRDYFLKIKYNGVEIHGDTGCPDEVHNYSSSTNLVGPVSYKWSLDGISPPKDLLGSDDTLSYTFDTRDHILYLVATGRDCGIQTTVFLKAKICEPQCPMECGEETVSILGGSLVSLIDVKNNVYLIPGHNSFACVPSVITTITTQNDRAVKAIKDLLKGQPHCSSAPISVTWKKNSSLGGCINLTIKNSPIKFKKIIVGDQTYTFNTTNC